MRISPRYISAWAVFFDLSLGTSKPRAENTATLSLTTKIYANRQKIQPPQAKGNAAAEPGAIVENFSAEDLFMLALCSQMEGA